MWRGAAATKALIRIFIIAKISGKLRARFSKLLKIFLRSSQVLSFKSYDFIKIVLGFENRARSFPEILAMIKIRIRAFVAAARLPVVHGPLCKLQKLY